MPSQKYSQPLPWDIRSLSQKGTESEKGQSWYLSFENVILVTGLSEPTLATLTVSVLPNEQEEMQVVGTCCNVRRAGRLHVGHHGSQSSQKSPAKVWVSRANDPLSQRKSSDTCLYWPSSKDSNSGLQLSWGERVALSEPERHHHGAF